MSRLHQSRDRVTFFAWPDRLGLLWQTPLVVRALTEFESVVPATVICVAESVMMRRTKVDAHGDASRMFYAQSPCFKCRRWKMLLLRVMPDDFDSWMREYHA